MDIVYDYLRGKGITPKIPWFKNLVEKNLKIKNLYNSAVYLFLKY